MAIAISVEMVTISVDHERDELGIPFVKRDMTGSALGFVSIALRCLTRVRCRWSLTNRMR